MIALLALTAAAGLPTVELSWKGAASEALIQPPAGEHIAPDSNASLRLDFGGRELSLDMASDVAHLPIALGDLRGAELTGSLRAPICQDDGSACRMVEVELAAVVPAVRRGRLRMDAAAPQPVPDEHAASSPFRRDASDDVEAALAESRESGRPVLLDFTAVWCPPCNLMSAEVFHAPDAEAALSQVLLVAVDVDDPSSWTLKDRYEVGGYPTVVAVDGDGNEIDRLLGYDNREATFAWIEDVADGQVQARIPEEGPLAVSAEEAALVAQDILQRGDEGFEPWLERAESEPDLPATRVARIFHEPQAADARWLLDNAPETSSDWLFAAMPLTEEHPELVREVAALALPQVDGPVERADVLYVMATASEAPASAALFSGAAGTLHSAFTGDAQRDRAHVTFLASLYAHAGQVDDAVELLDTFAGHFPDEPTWALSEAGLLHDAGRDEEALAAADRAVALAWGDNALRAAKRRVDILVALDRGDEARRFAAETLAAQPAPDEGMSVRTHRYRAALAELAEGVATAQ